MTSGKINQKYKSYTCLLVWRDKFECSAVVLKIVGSIPPQDNNALCTID